MAIKLLIKKGNIISKYIYGQFSEHLGEEIYGGENSGIPNVNEIRQDVGEALRMIRFLSCADQVDYSRHLSQE